MSDDTRNKLAEWMTDLVKSVGFPIMVSCGLLYFGSTYIEQLAIEAKSDRAFIRDTMVKLVQENNATMAKVAHIAQENQEILRRMDARASK